jgi:hypothetical protein
MNSNHDVMNSLGNVLSTVSISSSDVEGRNGAPGQQGGYGAPGIAVGSSQPSSWGSVAPAPAG